MNLLTGMMEEYVMLIETTTPDGYGGFTSTWATGDYFMAYVRKETTPEITVAEQQVVKETFTVIVPSEVVLDYHDVFRRVSDNAVFRVTSKTLDHSAPAVSSVPIARANCERWAIP